MTDYSETGAVNYNRKTCRNVSNYRRPIISHHFSHVLVSFWLGIEQCSNRRRNLVPDESRARYARHMYQKLAPERKESIYGASFWLERLSWVLLSKVFPELLHLSLSLNLASGNCKSGNFCHIGWQYYRAIHGITAGMDINFVVFPRYWV